MKYSYAYKTSDGQRHEATTDAPSREAVFESLRAQGIKAIKVVAADGSKANGEVRVPRASWFVRRAAWVMFGILLLSFIGVGIAFRAGEAHSTKHEAQGTRHETRTAPRHQIYGDPVIVEAIEHGKTEAWLTNRVDQLLAWFAQPGKFMCPKGVDLRRTAEVFAHAMDATRSTNHEARSTNHEARTTISPADPREVRELKQIVNGLREECSAYLANGNGTPRSYWRRLIQRTQQEAQIYERTRRELEHETNPAIFEQKNQALRNLGLRTIPNPKDGE